MHWDDRMNDDDDEMMRQCCRKETPCAAIQCPEGLEIQDWCKQRSASEMCYESDCCHRGDEDDDKDDCNKVCGSGKTEEFCGEGWCEPGDECNYEDGEWLEGSDKAKCTAHCINNFGNGQTNRCFLLRLTPFLTPFLPLNLQQVRARLPNAERTEPKRESRTQERVPSASSATRAA